MTGADGLDDLRQQVRTLIAERAPRFPLRAGIRSPEDAAEQKALRQWTADLFAAGLFGGDWPPEHGGAADHDPRRDEVVAEELARAHVPGPVAGNLLAARALIAFGSDQQRAEHLPRMRTGQEIWCQLFSEPDAGSDLASLRTRAAPHEGGYAVSGQKVWTTNAQWADFGLLLARTDPDAPKHKGISAFSIDMRSPGILIRPLREMTGTTDFNEVFFDDVHVPASAIIGAPGDGWAIANDALAHERTGVGASAVLLEEAFAALWTRAKELPSFDAHAEARLTQLHIEIEALSALVRRGSQRWHAGRAAVGDAPMSKLMFSELNLALAELAVELLGPAGIAVAGDPAAVDAGRWQDMLLYARAYTIAGGSSEVMRNVIAERALGLPREATR
jgi:alkylation response protein AidB-like acyl-CoA dehydrogenase